MNVSGVVVQYKVQSVQSNLRWSSVGWVAACIIQQQTGQKFLIGEEEHSITHIFKYSFLLFIIIQHV